MIVFDIKISGMTRIWFEIKIGTNKRGVIRTPIDERFLMDLLWDIMASEYIKKNYIYSIFFNNFTNFYFFRLLIHFVYFVQNSPFIWSSNISTQSYQIYFIWIILNFHKHFILFTLSFIFALYFMNLNVASLRIKHCIYYTYECVFMNT